MVSDILHQNYYCVLGNEEKINQEKDLFQAVIKLDK